MREFQISVLAASLIFAVALAAPSVRPKTQSPPPDTSRTPVLVELFTSEGCSSCPPADTILQKLVERQPISNADVIAIEEHVDYWNHDGWIDPFSSVEWTDRQMIYSPLTNDTGPYTPEMVVDGKTSFAAADPPKVVSSIEAAAATHKVEVSISAEGVAEKNSREFNVTVGKLISPPAGDSAEVWLAVTEDGLRSSVSAGENAGHALTHVATLRTMHKIGVTGANAAQNSFSSRTRVKFDSHWNAANLHVIVFVQEKKSHAILGVASAKLAG
ncbi:MAG TPA: DUF1223 domain-containing protein [Candidatus Acidoferrales bacterium]|nr:DUF1223 domain-containing protein [Candidatus Acidoferrales bacterium]